MKFDGIYRGSKSVSLASTNHSKYFGSFANSFLSDLWLVLEDRELAVAPSRHLRRTTPSGSHMLSQQTSAYEEIQLSRAVLLLHIVRPARGRKRRCVRARVWDARDGPHVVDVLQHWDAEAARVNRGQQVLPRVGVDAGLRARAFMSGWAVT